MCAGKDFDETVNVNEQVRFNFKHKEEMLDLVKDTHFDFDAIQSLSLIYYYITKSGKKSRGISREQLEEILHYGFDMTDYRMMDSVLAVIDKGEVFQRNVWTLKKWIKMLSIFLRGTKEELIQFSFDVYASASITEDNISRNNVMKHIKRAMISELGEDAEGDDELVKDLADMLVQKMDHDEDGVISYEDFKTEVARSPLMMECLGQTVPSRLARLAFRTTFTSNYGFK